MATKKRSIPLADSGIDWTKPAGQFTPSAPAEAPAEEVPQDGMMRRYLGDTAASVGRGAVMGVRMLADTAGADNAVSTGLRSVEDYIGSLQSASAKADQQEMARILKDAEGKGVLDQVVAGFKAFGVAPLQTMAQAAGTSLPTIGASLIPGVGPAAVAARFAAPRALGAAQGAGAVKSSIYDEVKQRALQEGRTPAEAEQLASQAQEYAGANGGQIALGAGLGAWAGKSGLEGAAQRLAYGTGGKAAPGMLARVGMGAVAEGIPEAAQGGQEKYASNTAQTNAGFKTNPMSGVVASATMEGLAGHAMGGAMGIPNPSDAPPVVDPARAAADAIRAGKQPEGGPMTRATNAAIEAQAQAAEAGLPPLEFTPTAVPNAGKPLALADKPDTTALDFEADPRFAGAMTFPNGDAPKQPVFATKQLADIHIGEQGAMGELEPVEAGGGQWTVKQTDAAANKMARANIEQWMGKAMPMPEEKARALAKDAESQLNKQMTPLPMPDGSGWTVVPTQWVSAPVLVDYMERAALAAERATPALGYDTAPTGRMRAGPGGVAPETNAQAINTRQAQAERDAEAQRRADLGLTPDVQAVQDRNALPKPLASDIKNPKGLPFTHQRAAETAQKKAKGGTVLQVAGGWVVRPDATESAAAALSPTQEPANVQAASVPPAAAPAAQQEGVDRAGAGTAEAAAPGAAGPTGAATAAVEADGVDEKIAAIAAKPRNRLTYVTQGDGTVAVGPELDARTHVNLNLTPAERKAVNRAKANAELADTPAERRAADAELEVAVQPAIDRLVGATPAGETATPAPAPETAIDRRNRLKAERAAPAPAPKPPAAPKQTFAEQAQEALDSVPGYKGKNTDGEIVYEDKRGVRSILRDGVRVTESVSMRPTRDGVKLAVEHKGEFLTAEEAKAAQDARQAPAPVPDGKSAYEQRQAAAEARERVEAENELDESIQQAEDAGAATTAQQLRDLKARLGRGEAEPKEALQASDRADKMIRAEVAKNKPAAAPKPADMAGFDMANDAEMALRQLAHADKRPGDVELGNGKFVTLEQAVAAAKQAMTPEQWGMPFQFNRALDIASADWNRMVKAMTGEAYRDPTRGGRPQEPEAPAPAPAAPSANTIFTEDAAAAARARLKAKFAQQAADAAAPAAAPMDVKHVGRALQAAKLSPAETSALEAQYGAKSGTEPFMGRLLADVVDHVNKGAEAVAKAVRSIVGKVAKAILSIAVVFNVAGLNPQLSSESYARTVAAMPKTVTVTETVQFRQAGKADLNGRNLSANATKVVNWIGAQGRPSEVSLVLDPKAGRLYVMQGGKIEADTPALFGKQGVGAVSGDTMNKLPDDMVESDKMTPAGRFPLALEDSGSIVTFARAPNGNSVYGFHRVYLGDSEERRQQRLDSATASDNAVSFGCVNVGTEFFNKTLKGLAYSGGAYGYLLPSDEQALDRTIPTPDNTLSVTRTTTKVLGDQSADSDQGGQGAALFTDRRRAASRHSSVKRGLDPETMMDGITMAGYHVEKGARKFADFARAMVDDLGDAVKPYLQGWYMAVRGDPRAADMRADMDKASAVEDLDVDEVLATTEPADTAGDDAPADDGAATGPESETDDAGDDTGTSKEPSDERALQDQGPQALDGVAAAEGGDTEGGGRTGRSTAGGRKRNPGKGGRTDGAGVSTPRSGGSGAPRVRAPEAGTQGAGDAGAAGGTRRKRKGAPQTDAVDDLFTAPEPAVPAAPQIPAANFRITPDLKLGEGGEAEKFRDNLAAIRVLKTIEAENRRATAAEQRTLARYVGFGGLPNAFPNPLTKEFKPEWKARGEELQGLLSPPEHRRASNSTTDAHYTSETVTTAVWDAVKRLGFKGGLSLEMSLGSGNFIGLMPEDVAGRTRFIGVELDSITARIAKALYPQSTVLESGMQYVPLAANAFDLDIGNPPFGDTSLTWQYSPGLRGLSIHNQFFVAGLNALKPGGIQAKVVSRYLLDAQDSTAREMLAVKGRLLGAIRLPETAFKTNARTQVVTDIVFFQRREKAEEQDVQQALWWLKSPLSQADFRKLDAPGKERYMRLTERYGTELQWVATGKVRDPLGGEPMVVSRYFVQNPGMVVGTMDRSGSMQHGADVTVKLAPGADFADELAQRIRKLPEGVMNRSDEAIDAAIERHKSMADALEIAVSGQEPGQMVVDSDGKLMQVFERETPEGDYELGKREITAASPWSPQLFMDGTGQWYREVVKTGPDGKPLKQPKKDGTPGTRNVTEREVFGSDDKVPDTLRLGAARLDRLRDIAGLRDLLKRQLVLEAQDDGKAKMEANRTALAAAYDAYVAKHGFVSDNLTGALVNDMPDGALVQALELSFKPAVSKEKAAKTGDQPRAASVKRAPIMSRRVVVPYAPPGKADSATDAMQISLAERGLIDVERIAALRGITADEAATELTEGERPLAFRDPETGNLETRDSYLTGEVARKLRAARDAGLTRNAEALEAVQPPPISSDNVTVILGTSWVPSEVYADFVTHLTGEPAKVKYEPLTNTRMVSGKNTVKAQEWAARNESGRITVEATTLLQDAMNSQATKVYYTDIDGVPHLNKEDTELAGVKRKEIEREFAEWVFADSDRRRLLVAKFNEKFNTRVTRQHDGSHLMLPGKVPDEVISLRRHQKNAVWRGISERFMLLDHVVGAGKTYTAIARVMERRRMGLSRKPMIVVPNHMVEQFAADVYRLYPGAKVLAAGKKDFEKRARRRLFGKIATGDWDVVVVPHSSFQFIGLSPETEDAFLQEELRQSLKALKDAEADQEPGSRFKSIGVKKAEALVKKIEARIDAVKGANKDRLLTFEQMGVDDMTVDEAHEFKNLFYSTRMDNVRGMGDSSGSGKAFDLYTKVRYLRSTPTGSVVFMTGTPISNSAVEMFTMMRYLAADELRDLGLEHFDAWRTQFVDASTAYEQQLTGGVKEVARLGRSWGNARSLMDLYYSFTDAVTIEDIKAAFAEDNPGKAFPIPKVKGGERQQVLVKPSPALVAKLTEIFERYDGLPDIEDVQERNAERLRLMDMARKASLDLRAVDPTSSSKEEGGKLDRVADEVARMHKQWTPNRGTQLVFLDRSVPKSKTDAAELKAYDKALAARDKALADNKEDAYREAVEALEKFDGNAMAEMRAAQTGAWNAYQQIKDNLIARGIPANEIRFIQEANNDEQKQAMFDAVNAGDIRVLIGSTPRMGAGTNVQERLVGLHHVDVGWKPSDIEQREGRIVRQGNLFATPPTESNPNPLYRPDFEVEILAYATERTADASLWALNGMKLKTINGIRKYDGSFTMEFEDEDSLSMAQMAALASGDPLLLERIQLVGEIDKLERVENSHRRKLLGLRDRIEEAERDIKRAPANIQANEERSATLGEWESRLKDAREARSAEVEGKTYQGNSAHFNAFRAAMAAAKEQQGDDDKAKFAITINGKRITSKTGIENALDDSFGDGTPFEATIYGEKQITRSGAVRLIVEKARELAINLEPGKSEGFDIGDAMGMKLVGDVSRSTWGKSYDVTFSLMGEDGKILASEQSRDGAPTHDFSVQFLRAPFDRLFGGHLGDAYGSTARYYRDQMARMKAELPELQRQLETAGPFKQAEELAQKRDRLEEVTRLLTVGGKDLKHIDDFGMLFTADPQSIGQDDFGNQIDLAEKPAYSRTDTPPQPATGRRKAVEALVQQIAARWANAPEVVVVDSLDDPRVPEAVRKDEQTQQSQGAAGAPEGFFHGGKVYLVASQLRGDADVVRVLFHESLGHFGLRGTFGTDLGGILDRVAILQASKVRAKAKQYGLDYDKPSDRRAAAEEVLAEMAQTTPDLGWGKKAIAAVRTWLRQHVPGFRQMALSDDEVVRSYILPARAFVQRGGPAGGPGGGVRFSRAASATDSANFKAWFKGSKVVDAEGKPLVVYHGTSADFSAFDEDLLGSNTRHRTAQFGFFFSASTDVAAAFAGERWSGWPLKKEFATGANLMPVYLSVKNPYTLTAKEFREKFVRGRQDAFDFTLGLWKAGHDGIRITGDKALAEQMGGEEFGADAWVAWKPEQIKSATGNSGAFDPGNADIRYSRASMADAVRDFSQAGARNAFLDAVTTHGGTNLWTRTVGTQYHKAKTNPTTFGRVFDAVQDYIKDTSVFANRAADNAPSLLPKLDSWVDLKKGGLRYHGAKPADTAKAGEAIFRGTLDKVLYDAATLRSRFGLNDLQVGLYQEFRAAVDESLDGMAKAEIVRLAGKDAADIRPAVLDADDATEAASIVSAYLTEAAQDQPAGAERDRLMALAVTVGKKAARVAQLKGEGYAPLMRFGKHTVHVQADDGSTEFFGMYESVREANIAARAMRADPALAGMTFTQGVMSEEGHKLFNGMSLDALELFADATDNAQNPVYQEYLKLALSNRSAMKRMIERKAIKGYSDDVARVLASFVTSNARMSAGNLHLTDAKKMAEAIPKEVGDLRDDAINLVEYVTNPVEEAAAARALLFTSFIGGSVASALVNMTQPITMTLPYLTQWGGVAKAGKRLAAAMAMVASGKGMSTELADALARAEQDGIVSPQEIHHLQAEAMNTLGKHPFLKKAAFVWGAMFSLAEQFNRRVSFVAAYQTAKAEGIANPFEFAEKAVVETQGLYNKGNKANWARGAVGATVMTFKQFSTHYLEFLTRMAKSGPEGRKAVAVALALLLLTAGAGGLPFADDLDDLIDTLGQAMGHDTNSKRWKRQFVSQTLGLGDDAAEVATRGLSALPGMPIDLSLRMGLGNLLPATGLFLRSNTDTGRQLLEIAGAAGGLAANVMDGVKKAAGGDVVGGVMNAMPVAVQNMAKAAQMWDTGEYRNKKGQKVMEADGVDAAMKFIGFQPAAIARESNRVSETLRTVQLAKNVEGEIAGRWAQGMADNNQEAIKAARQELADWNKANPQAPIRITMPQVLQRLKALRSSRAERTLKQTPKELRPLVAETLK